MADQDNTDIHKPDGVITRGDRVGLGDKRSHIRKRDGLIFRGEEVGYVDEDGNIRRPDGIILRGEAVGQVKDNAAHAQDGIIFSGEKWGYVDNEGNVRQRDGIIFRGRIIGKMRGHNKAAALGYFVLRFDDMEKRFEELRSEARAASNKGAFLGKVRHMLDYVPKEDALGDFDGLIRNLKSLEQEIISHINRVEGENRRKKEALISRAESLSTSTDWKGTASALQQLQNEWKAIGPVEKEHNESLWARFRAAQDKFYQRRTAFFEQRERERGQNRAKKEALCSRVESLRSSTDWKTTGDSIKGLQEQWKQIGAAGRDHDDQLWNRFRAAVDNFFERRSAYFDRQNAERQQNLHRKERICAQAESLTHASDTREAVAQVKELQATWKTIGHVPREDADRVWERFRSACDRVFEHARRERERKQAEWESKMRDTLSRKREQASKLRESIDHDEENVSRWQSTIYGLREGRRADEIRSSLESKISDVQDKIRSKRDRLHELEESIRDLESKLRQ